MDYPVGTTLKTGRTYLSIILGFWALIVCTSFSAVSADTIYVDGQLSGDCNGTYSITNRNCSGSDGNAYNTLQEAANVATAGDTILIRAGTYNQQLRPANSGTVAGYITFRSYGSETVTISLGSDIAIDISDRNYIILDGLTVDESRWLEAVNAHYNIVQNCTFSNSWATGTTGNVRFISSTYNRILNNVIYEGNDNLLLIDSEHNLVQGNSITEGAHSLWGIRCGDYNVIRNNYFYNSQQKIGEVYDCGEDTSAVPNSFDSTKHNLIEGNEFGKSSTYYATTGGNGIQYAGQNGIIRKNVFYNCGVGLGMQVYSDEALYVENNRVYQNVFYDNTCAGIGVRGDEQNDVFKNNILYWNKGISGDCYGTGPAQIVFRGSIQGYTFQNNNIFNQSAGQDVIHEEFGTGVSLTWFQTNYPGVYRDNVEVNPGFVNAAGADFTLDNTSPMIDAGGFLTHTANAGSGTVVPVLDASYFYDGFGIDGEIGDLIRLEGQNVLLRITAVNYTANTLTLSASISWSAGQGVALAYSDSAPDMGAFESRVYNPVYRFWSPKNEHHFYTSDVAERDKLINEYADSTWTYEGQAFDAFATDSDLGLSPVYRFWSPLHSSHFYTIDEAEKDRIIAKYASNIWTYEGINLYAYADGDQPAGAKPIYRFWSPIAGGHFYTMSETEKNKLITTYSHAWTYEGVAWYAYE